MRFEDVLPALRAGKKVRKENDPPGFYIQRKYPHQKYLVDGGDWTFDLDYILNSDDWVVMEDPPLPCPFCKRPRPTVVASEGCLMVQCLNPACHAMGPYAHTAASAVEFWNKAMR